MVLLHVKRGDEGLFLVQASVGDPVEDVLGNTVTLHNGRLKVHRICQGMEQLADHGYTLPPEMHGLTSDQIVDLKLKDEHEHTCIPSGGYIQNSDQCGRRCGRQPVEKMREVLHKTIREAKAMISKELVGSGTPLTEQHLYDALEMLRGAVSIVYPMGLPVYDPIRQELENREDLTGTQDLKMVLDAGMTQLWFAGKEMQCGKKLIDYFGRNEKSKVVVKLQKRGDGAPGREPALTEEQRRTLMASEFRRREELKFPRLSGRAVLSLVERSRTDARALKGSQGDSEICFFEGNRRGDCWLTGMYSRANKPTVCSLPWCATQSGDLISYPEGMRKIEQARVW